MKKFITLLIILCTTTFAFALYEPTRLTISSFGNASLRIMIDGNKYTSNNNNFLITNLSTGYHTVKIYQQKKTLGKKVTYKLIYNGKIIIKPLYHTDIMINRFGKAYVDEIIMGNGNINNQDNGWNNNDNNDWDLAPEPMSIQSFEQLKEAIRNESFDDDKLAVAKQAVGSNYFTVAQIKELMGLFRRDNSKLEIAKYAYKFTIDKGNYFMLNDALTFKSDKEELIKYIETVQE